MKFLAVNGSPRRDMNTGSLLKKITEGAAVQGAEVELVHLKDLAPFRGCISCFHCKKPGGKHYGRCAIDDALTPLLNQAHEADVLVLGAPIYLAAEPAMMRAFMERLIFQYYLYTREKPPLSTRKKAAALVYTMNVKEADLPVYGYDKHIGLAKAFLEGLFAPCELFLSCDTAQFKDYSKYEVDVFDVPAKLKRHEEVFPKELEAAFALGQKLCGA